MAIPRLQLVELEDLPWFPQVIRDLSTDYLHFMEERFGLHKPAVPLLRRAIEDSKATLVVDLCSGGGGPVLFAYEDLISGGVSVQVTLTDKYPNMTAFRRVSALHPKGISYVADSIDATAVPLHLTGLRTMFNAFHHFAPEAARRVLQCAVEARQPIGIFEIPERRLATIIPLFFTPLFVVLATPFIRPFLWRRLLWTYLLPLVPLTCWWDGWVSQLRAYTPGELLALTRGFDAFKWEAGLVGIDWSPGHLTYLIGHPKG